MTDLIEEHGKLAAMKREAYLKGDEVTRAKCKKRMNQLGAEIRCRAAEEHAKAGTKPVGTVPKIPQPQSPSVRMGFWLALSCAVGVGLMHAAVTYGDRLTG